MSRRTSKTCAIEGCARAYLASGYCKAHYARLARHGDPLAGGAPRPPKGEPMRWLRAHVGHTGEGCLIWPFKRNSRDGRAALTDVNILRVMCGAAHGPPPSDRHHAAHSCGKAREGCIHPAHLRWATPTENAADKYLHGTAPVRLSDQSARDILRRWKRGRPGKQDASPDGTRALAAEFGVSEITILQVVRGQTWKHLDRDPWGKNRGIR